MSVQRQNIMSLTRHSIKIMMLPDLLPCPASPPDLQKPVALCIRYNITWGGGGGGGEVQYSDRAHDA